MITSLIYSVAWQIKELILEYAAQIDSHIEHLLLSIRNISWRTNPNIFVGARVAVFRKGATLLPTVVTGYVTNVSIKRRVVNFILYSN